MDKVADYIRLVLGENPNQSWFDLLNQLQIEYDSLPPVSQRSEADIRRSVFIERVRGSSALFESVQSEYNERIGALIKTNAGNVETTNTLVETVVAQGKRAGSFQPCVPAPKAARLAEEPVLPLLDVLDVPVLPAQCKAGTEQLTDDENQMSLVDEKVYDTIMNTANRALDGIAYSDHAEWLFGADWGDLTIPAICDMMWEGGVTKVWTTVGGPDHSAAAACGDEDVRYVLRCFEGMRHGEVMSAADQKEKHARTGDDSRKGKLLDYLYLYSKQEHGCAENSGPETRTHEMHAKEDLVNLARTARSQILALQESGPFGAPVVVPYYLIFNDRACFYLQFSFAEGLFAAHKFFELQFPKTNRDVTAVLAMAEAFLTFRGIMERTASKLATTTVRPGVLKMRPLSKKPSSAFRTPKKSKPKKDEAKKDEE
ncbi:hypothetical protein HDU90_002046 [Geranomyces variabilis]|nr:hypothetical protein HDU90_002046 [Geranomyces variabilis]